MAVSSLDGNQLRTEDNRLGYNTLGQVIQLHGVSDAMKGQEADVVACPEVAGYNDRILGKERRLRKA